MNFFVFEQSIDSCVTSIALGTIPLRGGDMILHDLLFGTGPQPTNGVWLLGSMLEEDASVLTNENC
eukprot:5572811-Amphidinium_carterae.1